MAKQLLRIDLDTSFHLYGISCHLKDYRFAWTVNKSLGVEFKKTKPYTTVDGLEFSKYEYQMYLETIFLFANKSKNGFLIKKKKEVDYWMMFHQSFEEKYINNFVTILRTLQPVLVVFEEKNNQTKEYFVF